MKILSLLFCTVFLTFTFAQEGGTFPPEVDVQAEFKGGESAMSKFLEENIKYPEEAMAQGFEGVVYIGFYVEESGELSDIQILRGVDDMLDAEALRVVKLMPNWIPATADGKAVKSQMTLPIKFKL